MIIRTLFIQILFVIAIHSGPIEKKDDGFGSSENFLKTKVEKPYVQSGNGKVHEISQKTGVAENKKEDLDRLLKEIYENFIGKGKEVKVVSDKRSVLTTKQPTKPPTTAKINFIDLEHSVDELIKALSLKTPVKELGTELKYPAFHDVGEDKNKEPENNLPYEEFKRKFKQAFLPDSSVVQRIPFTGKKLDKADRYHSSLNQKLPFTGRKKNDVAASKDAHTANAAAQTVAGVGDLTLSELYNELKREVQIEKEMEQMKSDNKGKVKVKVKVKNVPNKKEESTQNSINILPVGAHLEGKKKDNSVAVVAVAVVDKQTHLEEKKRELISLLRSAIESKKDAKLKVDKKKGTLDAEFDKLYNQAPEKKNVEQVFIDKFSIALNAKAILKDEKKANDADVVEKVNNYVDKQRREYKLANNVHDYSEPKEQAAPKAEKQEGVQDPAAEKREKLRTYLIDLIETLKKDESNSAEKKRVVDATAVQKPKDSKNTVDATRYEDELETISSKKEVKVTKNETDEISKMLELLKGFEVNEDSKPNDRP